MLRTRRQHLIAVLVIAAVATAFGCGFAATQTVLRAGMSVGASISVRFLLGTIGLTLFLKLQRVRFDRPSFRDGLVLGGLLVTIFWLQTDGLQYTTTAKSGLITSLYVPFTPLIAFFFKERVKFWHAVAALIANVGLCLLVHQPGNVLSGWNRGDFETLVCAVLCTFHVVCTSRFSRRSKAWVLAWTQVAVVGILSAMITIWLPAPYGFQGALAALRSTDALLAMAFMVCFTTIFGFWGISSMQAYLSATEAAVVYSFEPVVAALVGVYWVGESFTPAQMIGAGLILLGMLTPDVVPMVIAKVRMGGLAENPAD